MMGAVPVSDLCQTDDQTGKRSFRSDQAPSKRQAQELGPTVYRVAVVARSIQYAFTSDQLALLVIQPELSFTILRTLPAQFNINSTFMQWGLPSLGTLKIGHFAD